MSSLSIGLSALSVNQRLLDLTGQNIANASTPGYHRQIASLAARVSSSTLGTGVEISNITRAVSPLLEAAAQRNTSSLQNNSTQLAGLKQLESYLAPGDGTIHDLLNNFFDAAEQLSVQPADLAQRRVVLSTASALADQINALHDQLDQLSQGFEDQAAQAASTISTLASNIAKLNQQIHDTVVQGGGANDLFDRRDQALTQLSELIDVRTISQDYGQINVFAGGVPLVLNSSATPIAIERNAEGQIVAVTAGSKNPLVISGGSLAGLQQLHNAILPSVQERFADFTNEFVARMNSIQASGLGLDGPATSLVSQTPIARPNTPLVGLEFKNPPTAGDLYVTVTNLASGQRSLHRIAIDPTTTSLSSLATSLAAVPHLGTALGSQNSTLNIIAQSGYGFDFTGNFSTTPDTKTIAGSTQPTFSGTYRGAANDTLSFTFSGPGSIGITPNLNLEARDGSGAVVGVFNVGQGYEAGSDLNVLGVKVKLASGTVAADDTFTLDVVANSDTSGILPALGIAPFFVGDGANGLAVRPDLLEHPERFALSQSGQSGDGSRLAQIIALRDQPVMNGSSQSLTDSFSAILGDVGSQVSDTQSRNAAYQSLGQSLEQQRQGATGVDANEEMIRLVQYQRSFQASARFLSVVNDTLDELFRLI